MPNAIPSELRNPKGLKKLKDFYAAELKKIGGDETSPSLKQLRSDIQSIERELVGKPLAVASAARK